MKLIEKFFDFEENQILNSTSCTILIFIILGIVIPNILKWSLTEEVWFWFFSTTAQTFAALVAVIIVIYNVHYQSIQQLIFQSADFQEAQPLILEKLEADIKIIKIRTWEFLKIAFPIIIISVFLIPCGSLKMVDVWDIWYTYNLSWIFIFIIMGLCCRFIFISYINIGKLYKFR